MNLKRLLAGGIGAAALIAVALLALHSGLGRELLGGSGFVRYIENDHGTYYRLKVQLAYKGEEQDFDIVIGCNVHVIGYKDNSSTYEVGLVPTVFGRRMSDGKGLVVRPPNACQGETTANGKVQPDLLPVIIVYDDADTLSFGTAYLSEDAYERPMSVLKFGAATIETATRAEFEKFRRTQPNLVTRESYHSLTDSDAQLKANGITRLTHPFGYRCQVYDHFRLPDNVRALARQYWPESKPTYWRPDTYDQEREIRIALMESKDIQSDRTSDLPLPWKVLLNIGSADRGLVRRSGGGLVSPRRETLLPPAMYPATDDWSAYRWPRDWTQWKGFLADKKIFATTDVDYQNGKMRGFGYCGVDLRPTGGQRQALASVDGLPKVYRVDGQNVVSKRPMGAVGDTWIFDRDESVFINHWLYLGSTRGDV
jgi:hypothetical protein